jgi:hypothetical protein
VEASVSSLHSVAILRESVQGIEELCSGYRVDLVNALVDIIGAQDQGFSPQKRRLEVLDIVKNLGTKVARENKDG